MKNLFFFNTDEPSIFIDAPNDDVLSLPDSLHSFGSVKTVNSWELNKKSPSISESGSSKIQNSVEFLKNSQKQYTTNSKTYQKQISEPSFKNISESSKIVPPPPPLPEFIPKSSQNDRMGSIKSTKSSISIRSMPEGILSFFNIIFLVIKNINDFRISYDFI